MSGKSSQRSATVEIREGLAQRAQRVEIRDLAVPNGTPAELSQLRDCPAVKVDLYIAVRWARLSVSSAFLIITR